MKALAIFGSTGVTGLALTEYALARGHTVFALARNPLRLQLPGLDEEYLKNLHIVQGDIYNQGAVDEVVSKADVVIETLGVQVNRKTSLKEDGAKAIIAAMKAHNKTRFIAVTSVLCVDEGWSAKPWLQRAMRSLLMNHIEADLKAMESVIAAERSWLDFTVIRPPQLVPAPPTHQCTFSSDGSCPPGTHKVTFNDLALAMLDSAAKGTYSGQFVMMNGTVDLKVGYKEMEKMRMVVWDAMLTKMIIPSATVGAAAVAFAFLYKGVKQLQAAERS